ncbi:MAG: hypothetical protein V2B18_14920, partial [Pseudomonadota bacterium]
SKCTEAWVVAAFYGLTEDELLEGIECSLTLENWLSQRRIREGRLIRRGKKTTSAYRSIAGRVTDNWGVVCNHCSQAILFADEVRTGLKWTIP